MSTLEKRKSPYLWITHITGLIAGEQCRWAAWLKGNYSYEKVDQGDRDALSRWQATHAQMVDERRSELEADGWTVTVEDQNKITVRGQVTVGGKMDIVAIRGDDYLISDPKGGRPRDKYPWQVRAYMILAPMADVRAKGKRILGEIVYPPPKVGGRPKIERVTVKAGDAERIFDMIRMVAGAEPDQSPSASECRYCNIAACDARDDSTREGFSGGAF